MNCALSSNDVFAGMSLSKTRTMTKYANTTSLVKENRRNISLHMRVAVNYKKVSLTYC